MRIIFIFKMVEAEEGALDVPCNLKYVDIFGFISIPVMASTGFLTIFLALLYYDLSRKEIVE